MRELLRRIFSGGWLGLFAAIAIYFVAGLFPRPEYVRGGRFAAAAGWLFFDCWLNRRRYSSAWLYFALVLGFACLIGFLVSVWPSY